MLALGVTARARCEGGGDVKAEKWKVKEAKGAAAPLKEARSTKIQQSYASMVRTNMCNQTGTILLVEVTSECMFGSPRQRKQVVSFASDWDLF